MYVRRARTMLWVTSGSVLLLAVLPLAAGAQAAPSAPDRRPSNADDPPPVLSSTNGRLEVTLTAQSSPLTLDGQTWSSMQYNGRFLPPVLRVKRGDSLLLHLVNHLPATQRTNIHYHGTTVSPKPPSDNVLLTVDASQTYENKLYFPPNHDRGLFWYHSHSHKQSEEQVRGGMSGLLVVEGFLEQFYPWLTDVPERLLMLKDPVPPGTPDSLGHVKTLNGTRNATLRIRPGELQFWRIGNIGAIAFFNLKVEGHRMWVLARDANAMRRPELVDSLFLSPGARLEVLIEGGAPGRYTIRHAAVNTGPAGDPNLAQTLGTLVVEGAPMNRRADVDRLRSMADIPSVVQRIEGIRHHAITSRRTFVFSESPDGKIFYINSLLFNMDSINTQVRLGDVEEWTLINTAAEWHTFHIHQGDFLITEVNGVPQPDISLRDVINIPYVVGGQPGIVKVIIPFTDPVILGKFVYHCHILEHEDAGMMQIIRVIPAVGAPPATPGSGSNGHRPGHR